MFQLMLLSIVFSLQAQEHLSEGSNLKWSQRACLNWHIYIGEEPGNEAVQMPPDRDISGVSGCKAADGQAAREAACAIAWVLSVLGLFAAAHEQVKRCSRALNLTNAF